MLVRFNILKCFFIEGLNSDEESEDSDQECEEVDSSNTQPKIKDNHSNNDEESCLLPNQSSSPASLMSDSLDSECGLRVFHLGGALLPEVRHHFKGRKNKVGVAPECSKCFNFWND